MSDSKDVVATSTDSKLIRNSILAGSMAGITSTSLFHPMDVLRTRIQAVALTGGTTSWTHVLRHTVTQGGISSLYTGITLPVTAQAVYKATVFTINNKARSTLLQWKGKDSSASLSLLETFACGVLACGINAALFVSPVEFVRNQLIVAEQMRQGQAQHKQKGPLPLPRSSPSSVFAASFNVIRSTLQTSGLGGLWRGVGVTMARDSVGGGFYFLTFETCRDLQARYLYDGDRNAFTNVMTSGACAGVAFWIAAMPFDTLKTLVQTSGGMANASGGGAAKLSAASSATASLRGTVEFLLQQEQYSLRRMVQRVYRGWEMALGRGMPGAAVTFSTYVFVEKWLQSLG